MRYKTLLVLALVLAGSTLSPTAGRAQNANRKSIGVNFGGIPMAAGDQPGVAPGGNWNNVTGSSGIDIALADNTGAATSTRLSFNSTGSYNLFSFPDTANPATNRLYGSGIFGNPAGREVSVTLTNIPYAYYNVYVYASADSLTTNTLSITDGITTYYYGSGGRINATATKLLLTSSSNPLTPTIGPAQYQLFSGSSRRNITITTGGSVSGVLSNNLFGLQIVAAPEPSSLALVSCLSFLGICAGISSMKRHGVRACDKLLSL